MAPVRPEITFLPLNCSSTLALVAQCLLLASLSSLKSCPTVVGGSAALIVVPQLFLFVTDQPTNQAIFQTRELQWFLSISNLKTFETELLVRGFLFNEPLNSQWRSSARDERETETDREIAYHDNRSDLVWNTIHYYIGNYCCYCYCYYDNSYDPATL